MNQWNRLDEKIGRVEQFLIAILLTLMILLAFLQIVLRNFFATGLSWGDSLIRYLVLWVGFIGATLATKEGKHINIDVFSRWVSGQASFYLQVLSHLFSTLICGLLAFAAWVFIQNEAQMGSITFLGIPAWILSTILPVTFGLMTLRFALRFFQELSKIFKLNSNREPDKEK